MTRGNTGHLHPINPEIDRTYHRLVRQSRNLPFHSVPDSVSDSDSISNSIPVSVHSVQYTDFVHSVALSDSEHSKNSVYSENMAQPPTPPGPRERTLRESYLAPRTFWTLQVDDVCKSEDYSYHKKNKTPLCVFEYKSPKHENGGSFERKEKRKQFSWLELHKGYVKLEKRDPKVGGSGVYSNKPSNANTRQECYFSHRRDNSRPSETALAQVRILSLKRDSFSIAQYFTHPGCHNMQNEIDELKLENETLDLIYCNASSMFSSK
ncbi:hypothetical protein Lal_00032293 [Lupinus albus]|nr:hypothetical protein Lal_00032293 [Lupinus albus]